MDRAIYRFHAEVRLSTLRSTCCHPDIASRDIRRDFHSTLHFPNLKRIRLWFTRKDTSGDS